MADYITPIIQMIDDADASGADVEKAAEAAFRDYCEMRCVLPIFVPCLDGRDPVNEPPCMPDMDRIIAACRESRRLPDRSSVVELVLKAELSRQRLVFRVMHKYEHATGMRLFQRMSEADKLTAIELLGVNAIIGLFGNGN